MICYVPIKPSHTLFALFLVSFFVFATSLDFDPDSGYLYVDEEIVPKTVKIESLNPRHQINQRWKREATENPESGTGSGFKWQNFPGAGYLRKLRKLIKQAKDLPQPIKDAISSGDFSNVTADDVRSVNVTVLEYIPPKAMSKMNSTVLEQIISMFLNFNRPNALGRLVEVAGNKLSPAALLDRINQQRSQQVATQQTKTNPNEAAKVLLYSAMSRLGETGGITRRRIDELKRFDLLKYIPEEQLMKVNDSEAAKSLLENLYGQNSQGNSELNEPDDKALVYKLLETQHGSPETWTSDTVQTVASKYLKFLPAAALKQLSPQTISKSIYNLRDDGNFDNPLQAKTVADAYMQNEGFTKNEDGVFQGNPNGLPRIFGALEKLAAFVNPATANNKGLLSKIISQCDKWNLPAPLQAVTKYLKLQFSGREVNSLSREELIQLSPEVLKNSPPELIGRVMETQALDEYKMSEIGKFGNSTKREGIYGNAFFKGLVAQLASYIVQRFKQYATGNKYRIDQIPTAFVGGVGVKGIQEMDNHQLQTLLRKLKENPNVLDPEQKALLLKRLRDENLLSGSEIPPEFSYLQPRIKGAEVNLDDLNGLPSDSELRLAHGNGKILIMPGALERDPSLIGTLTPKQVESVDLQHIPGILAAIRKSKDGPQPQTLKALSKKFSEYIRLKADDYETEDKKLLKYITAAEVSKLPASVLAYFVDKKQTAKLPNHVRKELMIALGEMSSKDRALIPQKTREEIILQGLDALDSITEGNTNYDVAELAAIGHSIGDLPPKSVSRLTPVAFEQGLDMIQGTNEEDDGLNQRACLTPAQRKAWRDKIVENYGKPKTWDPPTVMTLCCALPLLSERDLMSIDKESIVTCQCISDSSPPAHLAELKKSLDRSCDKRLGRPDDMKKTYERVRAERAMDLSDLESQILTRRKRAHNHSKHKKGLKCFALRLAKSPADFDHEMLSTIKPKEMRHCLYELGSVKLPHADERLLWEKLAEANGGVQYIPADQLRNAGYILNGIKSEEVNELNFADEDVLAAFGRPLGFSKTILKKMASLTEKVRKKSEYQPTDLIIVRNILCGFDLETLRRIVPEAFSLALPILRDLDPNCEPTHLTALANIATHPKVYGDPANWSAADVRGVGILFKGLTNITTIPPEAFLGLSPSVAGSLSEDTLSQISAEQARFIPKFSVEAMSENQINALSTDGRMLLERGPLITDAACHLTHPVLPVVTTAAALVALASIF